MARASGSLCATTRVPSIAVFAPKRGQARHVSHSAPSHPSARGAVPVAVPVACPVAVPVAVAPAAEAAPGAATAASAPARRASSAATALPGGGGASAGRPAAASSAGKSACHVKDVRGSESNCEHDSRNM